MTPVFHNGKCIGQLMPANADSRQQPKSLAFRMLENKSPKRWPQAFPRLHRPRTLTFMTDKAGGKTVYDRVTGQSMGYVLPSISPAVLAASPGIQSWSQPVAS